MSFASRVTYTGDGVTKQFNVPFPYLSVDHVNVYVNTILQLDPMNYTWSGPSTIQFGSAPGNNDAIEFIRNTSPTAELVDFVDGSVLRAGDLDTAYLHNFYLSQEYSDSYNNAINNILLQIATDQGIVETETDAMISAIVAEMLLDASAANLQARISDIDANAEAIITLGQGLQTQINTLAQGVAANVYIQADEPVPGVGGIPDPILDGSRWYDSDDNNKPYIYDSGAWVSIEDPRIGVAFAAANLNTVEMDGVKAALADEVFLRATEAEALGQRLDILGTVNGDLSAFILDLDTVKLSPTESLSQRFTQITADYNTNAAAITSEASTRATNDTAIADELHLLGAQNGAQTAFILDTSTVKIDSDVGDTFATRLNALSVADSNNSAAITTIQTVTIPGVQSDVTAVEGRATDLETFQATAEAEYGVTLDVNGNIAGFKLIANGAGSSSFVVAAEKFAIADPGNPDLQPFTVSGNKIVMNGDVSINGSLLLNGSVVGAALVAGTIGSTQIGANAITTTQLNASAVTADKIATNAVTAGKINVTNLAAINADLGAVTAGTLELDGAGWIKGGQSAFNTGTGYFLGYESGYKFSIGSPTGDRITWDGSLLTIVGDVKVGQYIVDATETIAEANTQRSKTGTSIVEVKKFTMDRAGDVRVYYERQHTGASYSNGITRIKKNGSIKYTLSEGSITWTSTYFDLTGANTCAEGDEITIEYGSGQFFTDAPEPGTVYIRNAQLRAVVTIPGEATVNTD